MRLASSCFLLLALGVFCCSSDSGGDANAGDGTSGRGGDAGNGAGGDGGAGAGGSGGTGAMAPSGGVGGSTLPDGPVEIARGIMAPTGIAVDGERVFIAARDQDAIVTCPLTGCDGDPSALVSNTNKPISLGLSPTHLYWVSGWKEGDSGGPQDRTVRRCTPSDCEGTLESFDAAGYNPYDVHVVDGRVYLAAWPFVRSCSSSGCTVDEVDLGSGPAVSIAGDATALYVAFAGLAQVSECTDACPGDTLMDGFTPMAVAVDDESVFVADYNFFSIGTVADPGATGRILACPKAGCGATGPRVVASGDITPYALEVHGDRLYYTNHEAGTVVSMPK